MVGAVLSETVNELPLASDELAATVCDPPVQVLPATIQVPPTRFGVVQGGATEEVQVCKVSDRTPLVQE